MKLFAIAFFSILLASCSRGDRYLFYSETPPAVSQEESHLIKELGGNSRVDILWVIDNSGSMSDDVQNVVDNADEFIQEFTKNTWLQWRMGVVSTDTDEDPYLGLESTDRFDYTDSTPVDRFQKAVRKLGSHGAPVEKIFVPVKMHLDDNPGFLRQGAFFVMISVTDTYELSDEEWNGSPKMNPTQFLSYVASLKPMNLVKSYGVFSTYDLGCPAWNWPGSSGNYAGSRLEEMTVGMNGVVYPLCDKDFGKNLSEMSKDIVNLVSHPRFFLKERPVAKSIVIKYNGEELPGGAVNQGGVWKYDYASNSIIFYSLDFAGNENEKVEVIYDIDDGFAEL